MTGCKRSSFTKFSGREQQELITNINSEKALREIKPINVTHV